MKRTRPLFLVALVVFGSCFGCRAPMPMIPAGKYVRLGTEDYIKVSGRELWVHFQAAPYRDSDARERNCSYTLLRDGRILLTIPGRSMEFVYGIGRFDYFLDGKTIRVVDPKSGEVVILVKK